MIQFFIGHYAYWLVFLLMTIGLYGMMMKRNLIKKIIGLTIFQVSVIMFFVATSSKWGGTVPVLDHAIGDGINQYINPLPHTLMLTAIVVGVATSGVAFALIITIYKRYRTLDERTLLERMKKQNDH